jgi:hypothetical protein
VTILKARAAEAGEASEWREGADRRIVVPYLLIVVDGLILGLVAGRWWTLLAAAGIGAWVAAVSDVGEVPPWFLGAAYAALAASAIAVGIVVRRRTRLRVG